ncbi:MAG TPA: FkbM family methyltransferase [Solirubrobacteraceae bacterium]|jgi:FkbM family methyltransferase|nr:FkbM family methyltransferase [Solirubrobacteraceae bacterium]
MIPRIIHRVWPGEDPLPAEVQALGETWATHHPGWELKLWRPSDLPPLRNQELFDAARSYALRSDIARYEVLLRYGGIYVDTDFECLRSFEDLLDGVEAFIGSENGIHLTNALMGAVAGHPLMEAIVAAIPESIAADPSGPPNERTGPFLVTRVVDADPALRDGLLVCEPHLFYPYLYNEHDRRDEAFPESYAVHHWSGSWVSGDVPQVPPRYRLVVATDWGQPTAAEAMLRAFVRLFAPQDPVEFAFAVLHEPGAGDLEHAQRLIGSMGIDAERCAPITLESFTEAAQSRYDVAVVGTGSAEGLVLEVAEAVGGLHDIRRKIDAHGRPALAAARNQDVLAADLPALARRLSAFRPGLAAGASAPGPAGTASPTADTASATATGHRATYLGDNRLLVSTNWGGKLFMSASDLSLTPEVLHDGNYDDPFTHFLQRTLRPGDVAFDIGANVGLFTVLMGRLVGSGGHVVAYEAAPENVALLRDSIAMNYYTDWVDVVAKAAAATEGTLQFHQSTRFQGNGSLLPHDEDYQRAYAVDEEHTLEVAAEPLDIHLGRFQAIHLVKVDVEGGEEQVLSGMQRLIASGTVDRICFELLRDRMGADWGPVTARLRALAAGGWSMWVLGGAGEQIAIDVDRVIEHGTFSQLLLTRPGLSG